MPIIIPDPITKPFCNTGDKVLPPVGSSTITQSQEKGIPPRQAQPLSTPGGLPVKIEEFNGTMNLYSQQIQALVSGGQFTFNQAVSDANGGYPAGIILYDFESKTLQTSLVANNTANFITNRAYLNDGENWTGIACFNGVNIKMTRPGDGLNILNKTETASLLIDLYDEAEYSTTFTWPLENPVSLGANALCTVLTPPNYSENKWVPLKTRITYQLTTTTPISIDNIVKFDTLYDSLNLTQASPYNPVTGIFTPPEAGTYKFEVTMKGEISGDNGGFFLSDGDSFPSVYADLCTFPSASIAGTSGFAYLKLNEGQTVAVNTNETFTPHASINQLSISWNT